MDTLLTVISPATAALNAQDKPNQEHYQVQQAYRLASLLSTIIGVYAFALSWMCSSGSHIVTRVIYAVTAYYFGAIYLIYYFFMRGECSKK